MNYKKRYHIEETIAVHEQARRNRELGLESEAVEMKHLQQEGPSGLTTYPGAGGGYHTAHARLVEEHAPYVETAPPSGRGSTGTGRTEGERDGLGYADEAESQGDEGRGEEAGDLGHGEGSEWTTGGTGAAAVPRGQHAEQHADQHADKARHVAALLATQLGSNASILQKPPHQPPSQQAALANFLAGAQPAYPHHHHQQSLHRHPAPHLMLPLPGEGGLASNLPMSVDAGLSVPSMACLPFAQFSNQAPGLFFGPSAQQQIPQSQNTLYGGQGLAPSHAVSDTFWKAQTF